MNAMLAVTLAAFAAAADAPAKPADAKIDAAKLFQAKCSACHAKDGTGSKAMAKLFKAKLEDLDLTGEAQKDKDADLVKIINEGKNKMPSFKSKLKEAEIGALVAYIRTLGAKPEAAPAKK